MKLIRRFSCSVFGLLVIACVLFSSCREDFETTLSTGQLEFSIDTIFLDTVFSNISSSTYQFKVYNRSNTNIRIPKIQLGEGEASLYRLNVDGIPGKVFQDIELLARDSMFVFIEVTADFSALSNQGTQFVYEDEIQFDTEANKQKVHLVTMVQDAVFLFPQRFEDGSIERLILGITEDDEEISIQGFFLDDEHLNFTNEKPYVIYGFAAIPSGKTLNIEAGTRIYFHSGAGLIAANNATIHANGSLSQDPDLLENEIIFQGDRLEPIFNTIPGQWATIWLTAGSTNHKFNYTTIKNGTVGVLMDSNDGSANPTLELKNTKIYNSANVGLLARTGFVDVENSVIHNAGQASVNLSLGGRYNFRHTTISNYWANSFRQFPALLIENNLFTGSQLFLSDLEEATFSNCIVYGSENIEFILNKAEGALFNYRFENSLVRFNDFFGNFDEDELYDFEDTSLFNANVFNENPDFRNRNTNQLFIGLDSGAREIGNNAVGQQVPFDLNGSPRPSNPDAGAYQAVEFPSED